MLKVKTPERGFRRHSSVFIVNFKHALHLFLRLLLLTLQVNSCWVVTSSFLDQIQRGEYQSRN